MDAFFVLTPLPNLRAQPNITHGRWGSCRYDTDARPRGSERSTRCQYKTEVEATLSMAGKAWEYYHFLIDVAPRVLFAMSRDGCDKADIAAPGWWPQHMQGTFMLTSRRNVSMAAHAEALFPGDGLRFIAQMSRDQLCAAPGKYLPFQPAVFDWSHQPVAWFAALRRRALSRGGVFMAPARTGLAVGIASAAESNPARGVLLIRRRLANQRRRHLAPAFFTNASAWLRAHGRVAHQIVELETLSLVEQAALFASPAAQLVVGVHGGGLSNLVFSPRGAAVLEVYTAAFPCYRELALRCGVHYERYEYGFR